MAAPKPSEGRASARIISAPFSSKVRRFAKRFLAMAGKSRGSPSGKAVTMGVYDVSL
jgi:hypothetical protein